VRYVIGLTGNIATGKSVVSGMLERLGARAIDADALAHELMEKGTPVWQAVVKEFGPSAALRRAPGPLALVLDPLSLGQRTKGDKYRAPGTKGSGQGSGHRDLPLEKARSFLGRFLFSGDDVFKLVGDLSGGERSRLALAKLTLEGANFLLLDEPTNHLDIASREILEEVLADFNGTILLVSHDRYLINALATQVWVIEDGELRVYGGNYSDYEEQRRRTEENEGKRKEEEGKRKRRRKEEVIVSRTAFDKVLSLSGELSRTAELEKDIATLEAQLAALGEELVAASAAQDVESLRELGLEYQRMDEELQRLLARWAEVGVA